MRALHAENICQLFQAENILKGVSLATPRPPRNTRFGICGDDGTVGLQHAHVPGTWQPLCCLAQSPVLEMFAALPLVSFHHDIIFEFRWDDLKEPVVELARFAEAVLAVLQQAVDAVIHVLMQLRNLCAP